MICKRYRLVTRSDMDGLVCAILLNELDIIDDIKFVHPKDMQHGDIQIDQNDITTNLPYVDGVYMAFDNHVSESIRNGKKDNHIIDPTAKSASRIVYDYYGGIETFKNLKYIQDMMRAVDKADCARFGVDDIINPCGWDLLNFILDARSGLERFENLRISNYAFMIDLIDYCKNHSIDEILSLPDVQERVELYLKYNNDFKDQILRCTKIYNKVVVLDLREEEIIYPGNRFMIYALFPECNTSIHVIWGQHKQNTVLAVGNSIINKSSKINIGELLLKYGGGGHSGAGTVQVPHNQASNILQEIISHINSN